jgi:hypothetical protein
MVGGMNLEGSGCDVVLAFTWAVGGKPRETLVKSAGVRAENSCRISLENYRYASLLSSLSVFPLSRRYTDSALRVKSARSFQFETLRAFCLRGRWELHQTVLVSTPLWPTEQLRR